MNIKSFKQALPYLIKSNVSLFIWGHRGTAKSEAPKQFAEENGYKFIYLNPGTQEVGDIIGLADFGLNKKGEKICTKFMPPDWLVETRQFCLDNPDKIAIIAVDEINRGTRSVLQALFPLVLEHRIHMEKLPSNCYTMAMANPNNDNYVVLDVSDAAFMSRFCHVKWQPTCAEVISYFEKEGYDDYLVRFLKDQPELINAQLDEFNLEEIKPCPRSWTFVNRLLQLKTPYNLLQECSIGLVGSTATTAFMASLKDMEKPIPALEILDNLDKHMSRIKKYSSTTTDNRQDLLHHTCSNLLKYVEDTKNKLTKEQITNLLTFIKVIPVEVSYNFCRKLYFEDSCRKYMDEDEGLKKMIKRARRLDKKEEKQGE